MTICYKYCVDLLCGRWPYRIEVAHIVEVYLSKLVRILHANLHLYFNLHVRLSLYPCVSHTSPFFRVHSTRCLIRPLLKLGYHSKAKPEFLVQSPLVIVDLLIVDSLVIVDRLSRPNVYFSMYFSCNNGFSH